MRTATRPRAPQPPSLYGPGLSARRGLCGRAATSQGAVCAAPSAPGDVIICTARSDPRDSGAQPRHPDRCRACASCADYQVGCDRSTPQRHRRGSRRTLAGSSYSSWSEAPSSWMCWCSSWSWSAAASSSLRSSCSSSSAESWSSCWWWSSWAVVPWSSSCSYW